MTAQPYNRIVFVSWSWRLPCNGNQALASITGHLFSMSMMIGQITRLMTRHLYALINSRSSWDSQVEIYDEVEGELQFWYSHIPILNGFLIRFKSGALKIPHCTASVIKTVKKKVTLDVIRNGAMPLLFFKE